MTTHPNQPEITISVQRPVALALLHQAGFEKDNRGRWIGPDGRWTWAADEALTWAIERIANPN